MKLLVCLLTFFCFKLNAYAQFDGTGHEGKVMRAFIINSAKLGEPLTPGLEHSRASEAVYPPADVTELIQTTFKLAGKGVRVKKTGEAVTFACIGAQNKDNPKEPSCDYLRALYHNPETQKTYAFGGIYYAGNQNLNVFFKSLKETWQQEGGPRMTSNKYIAYYSDPLSSQETWNWAESPNRIPYGRFLSIVADLQGAVLCYYTKVHDMIFTHMIQPKNPGPFSPWHSPQGGGYGPNGGYY